jgi:hypothetical protein
MEKKKTVFLDLRGGTKRRKGAKAENRISFL